MRPWPRCSRRAGQTAGCLCTATADRLIKVAVAQAHPRGVRDYYPLFSTRAGEARQGYEVDVSLAIGRKLGVDVEFVRVNAATRIALLAEDRIDLAIATMGPQHPSATARRASSGRTITVRRRR